MKISDRKSRHIFAQTEGMTLIEVAVGLLLLAIFSLLMLTGLSSFQNFMAENNALKRDKSMIVSALEEDGGITTPSSLRLKIAGIQVDVDGEIHTLAAAENSKLMHAMTFTAAALNSTPTPPPTPNENPDPPTPGTGANVIPQTDVKVNITWPASGYRGRLEMGDTFHGLNKAGYFPDASYFFVVLEGYTPSEAQISNQPWEKLLFLQTPSPQLVKLQTTDFGGGVMTVEAYQALSGQSPMRGSLIYYKGHYYAWVADFQATAGSSFAAPDADTVNGTQVGEYFIQIVDKKHK